METALLSVPLGSPSFWLLFLKLIARLLRRVSGFVGRVLRLVGYFIRRLLSFFGTFIDLVFHVISAHIYLVCLAVSVSTPCELTAFSPADETS